MYVLLVCYMYCYILLCIDTYCYMYIFLFSCVQVVRHGGCLGLGLAAMGTADQGQYIMEEYLSYYIVSFLQMSTSY